MADFEITFSRTEMVSAKTPDEALEIALSRLAEALNDCVGYGGCFKNKVRLI